MYDPIFLHTMWQSNFGFDTTKMYLYSMALRGSQLIGAAAASMFYFYSWGRTEMSSGNKPADPVRNAWKCQELTGSIRWWRRQWSDEDDPRGWPLHVGTTDQSLLQSAKHAFNAMQLQLTLILKGYWMGGALGMSSTIRLHVIWFVSHTCWILGKLIRWSIILLLDR